MLLHILFVIIGSALIIAGANFLTDGASALATRFKISQIVIGLTVVAFGTSAPELTVSVLSGLSGNGGMAVGNVIGSNIFNILAILGLTALIAPLPIGKSSRNIEIPMAILTALVLLFVIGDIFIDGKDVAELTRSEGATLLTFGLLFLLYTIYMGTKGKNDAKEEQQPAKLMKVWLSIIYIVGGLAGLVFGGRLFVDSASEIARTLGVSETLIGLTLVSWGTSMPELATSIVAAFKKNADIAIGNVVGSNIFNIFLVLGCTGLVHNQTGLAFTFVDLFAQLLAPVLLFVFARFLSIGTLSRSEGAVLFAVFVAYNWYIISSAIGA
ncbi:calcium/sodium antiporter [Porphyromonas sp.]|uniref:calcium/sodium antiporter n=1 Tax=Porphyromonas sp. TaxID=1924944 RepID=UPI0026DC0CD7|nr:calcium/sodium antiporter [Porphyromonas sp.]MDO4695392.1 calcium/sodium antiporter [Porphyromonas sp.]MDO4770481.1 calcium/sodium antiporter [Porphyromonas sp.]